MVFVPGGTLHYPWLAEQKVLGGTLADEVRESAVGAFCIDRREVAALDLLRSACPEEPGVCTGTGGPDPATCVTLERATCYCASGVPGLEKRLPSASEWLFAAVGETGRKFPWGSTWYPWGNDPQKGRPENGIKGDRFCARQLDPNYHSVDSARLVDPNYPEFPSVDCSKHRSTMDKSPFGVENMGSSVRELTSLVVLRARDEPASPAFGLDYAAKFTAPDGDPVVSLVSVSGPYRDTKMALEFRAYKDVGFRCALSEVVRSE